MQWNKEKENPTDNYPYRYLAAVGWQEDEADKFLFQGKDDLTYTKVDSASTLTEGPLLISAKEMLRRALADQVQAIKLIAREKDVFETGLTETGVTPEAILSNWQHLANSSFSSQSYLFILKLARKSDGWRGPGSKQLGTNSLSSFLKFWNTVKENAVEPEFALVPNGNIQAEWYKDEHHFIEIEFKPNNQVLFSFFDGDSIIEGIGKVDEVIAILSSKRFQPIQWSYD